MVVRGADGVGEDAVCDRLREQERGAYLYVWYTKVMDIEICRSSP